MANRKLMAVLGTAAIAACMYITGPTPSTPKSGHHPQPVYSPIVNTEQAASRASLQETDPRLKQLQRGIGMILASVSQQDLRRLVNMNRFTAAVERKRAEAKEAVAMATCDGVYTTTNTLRETGYTVGMLLNNVGSLGPCEIDMAGFNRAFLEECGRTAASDAYIKMGTKIYEGDCNGALGIADTLGDAVAAYEMLDSTYCLKTAWDKTNLKQEVLQKATGRTLDRLVGYYTYSEESDFSEWLGQCQMEEGDDALGFARCLQRAEDNCQGISCGKLDPTLYGISREEARELYTAVQQDLEEPKTVCLLLGLSSPAAELTPEQNVYLDCLHQNVQ